MQDFNGQFHNLGACDGVCLLGEHCLQEPKKFEANKLTPKELRHILGKNCQKLPLNFRAARKK